MMRDENTQPGEEISEQPDLQQIDDILQISHVVIEIPSSRCLNIHLIKGIFFIQVNLPCPGKEH